MYYTYPGIPQGVTKPGLYLRVLLTRVIPQGVSNLGVYLRVCLTSGCTSGWCTYYRVPQGGVHTTVYLRWVSCLVYLRVGIMPGIPQGVLHTDYTSGCVTSGLYLRVYTSGLYTGLYSRFTVGQFLSSFPVSLLVSNVSPCAKVLSVAGLCAFNHPFHCWSLTSPLPVSLLVLVLFSRHPFHCWSSPPRPCALSPHNLTLMGFLAPTKVSRTIIPGFSETLIWAVVETPLGITSSLPETGLE